LRSRLKGELAVGKQEKSEPEEDALPRVVVRPNRCKCGSWSCREANRMEHDDGTVSVMYECVACGEYRL